MYNMLSIATRICASIGGSSGLLSREKSPTPVVPPPNFTPPNDNNDQFSIKVTVYETDKTQKQTKRLTGYSQESDIIPKTVDYCLRHKSGTNVCTPPIVTTSSNNQLGDCIVVDDIIKKKTYVHFVKT